jgi:hypothetical protein
LSEKLFSDGYPFYLDGIIVLALLFVVILRSVAVTGIFAISSVFVLIVFLFVFDAAVLKFFLLFLLSVDGLRR